MILQRKIDAVIEYLQSEFPDFQVDIREDYDSMRQEFSVKRGSTSWVVKFERFFLETTFDIKRTLEGLDLSKTLKENEGKQLLVTRHGLTLL